MIWTLIRKIPASWVIIGLMVFALYVVRGLYLHEREERIRLSGNQEQLLDRINGVMESYRVRDSLNAVRVEALTITVSEFKSHFVEQSKLVRDMGVKLRDLQSLSSIATVQRYEVRTPLRDSVVRRDSVPLSVKTINYHSKWFDIGGTIEDNEAILFPRSRDSIVQTIDRIPKMFLFFRVGTKGIRQTVVSKNPNSEIVFHEFLYFKK